MQALPEVAVADADAGTHAIYQSIMTRSGTGTPALIFRHFAVFPGFLDWVWQAVGDELATGQVMQNALDAVARTPLVVLPPVSDDDLAGAGIDAAGRTLLASILASYNRMNPMNLGLIAAISDLIARPGVAAGSLAPLGPAVARTPPPCPALPPPVNVRDMPADLRTSVIALSAAIPASGALLVPTLYRHLAVWPDLVRLIAPGILSAIERGDVATRMTDLRAEMSPLTASLTARAREKGLPPPPLEDAAAMVRTLASFLVAIPQMIVVGAALEAAMPPSVSRGRA